jgi:hypothetical protein
MSSSPDRLRRRRSEPTRVERRNRGGITPAVGRRFGTVGADGRLGRASGPSEATSERLGRASGHLGRASGPSEATRGRLGCASRHLGRASGRLARASGRLGRASGPPDPTSGHLGRAVRSRDPAARSAASGGSMPPSGLSAWQACKGPVRGLAGHPELSCGLAHREVAPRQRGREVPADFPRIFPAQVASRHRPEPSAAPRRSAASDSAANIFA